MIERIDDMPASTIGLRASGTLTKDDYTRVLEPAIQEAVDSGELRILFELHAFDVVAEGAWTDDAKAGLKAFARDRKAWHRLALVTDVEWVAKATKGFSWMIPGESKVFVPEDVAQARAWVAG